MKFKKWPDLRELTTIFVIQETKFSPFGLISRNGTVAMSNQWIVAEILLSSFNERVHNGGCPKICIFVFDMNICKGEPMQQVWVNSNMCANSHILSKLDFDGSLEDNLWCSVFWALWIPSFHSKHKVENYKIVEMELYFYSRALGSWAGVGDVK